MVIAMKGGANCENKITNFAQNQNTNEDVRERSQK